MSKAPPKVLYEFGPFRVDPDKQVLLRENQPVPVTPKVFETLLVLVRHSRQDVSKDQLMQSVWPDAFVEEANLSQNISTLRKALGETPEDRRYIVTLPGRGYRFAEEVRTVTQNDSDVEIASHPGSEIVAQQEEHPQKQAPQAPVSRLHRAKMWKRALVLGVTGLLAIAGCFFVYRKIRPRPLALRETDSVLVADFANKTGDPVFDATLQQGLTVQLQQSPFLSLVPEDRVQQILKMMGQPPDARLTSDIAREVCQRTSSAAVLEGSIVMLGNQYVLGLQAKDCQSGRILDEEQSQAAQKEDVLKSLSEIASKFRARVGESLSTVQKFDTPLEQATTPSLEALKALSSGRKVLLTSGDAAAIPFFKRAVELDPNFALAYAWLGVANTTVGESNIATGYTRKAYELRDRTSEPEKYFISAIFHKEVTGNLEKAEQACKLWAEAYPHSDAPHLYLSGAIYPGIGQNEKAVAEAREAIRLNPDVPMSRAFLIFAYTALDRLDEAKAAYGQALERKLDSTLYPAVLYEIAFLQDDASGMAQQVAKSAGHPGAEDGVLGLEAEAVAYSGHLRGAREFSQRAKDSAERTGDKEAAATYTGLSALREALFGNIDEARRGATSAIVQSAGRDVRYGAALAFAYAGDVARAQALIDELGKRFPEDTIVQFNYLPTLRAKLAIMRGNSFEALADLRMAMPNDLGQTTSSTFSWTAMHPVFVRGEAFLSAHQGKEAAAEFQTILDHRGLVGTEAIGALAHLQLGRAYAMQGETANAKTAYHAFITLWKDADPEIPILKQARIEYSRLE